MSVAALALERAPAGAGTRFLVVNADDFGMSEAVNAGVVRGFERGIVTSTSLMVDRLAAEGAARYARAHPRLGVGLHLDLSEWEYRDGEWRCLYERVSLDDAREVEAEVDRQLARFEALAGRPPTHIDSHQHVHRGSVAGAVVSARALALGVPARDLSPGVRYRGEFYGQSSKGDPYPEWIAPAKLVELLESLASGVTELGCHPAAGQSADGAYASERVVELSSLCHPDVLDAVLEQGITLVSFADVAELLDQGVDAWRRGFEERSVEAARAGDHGEAESWLLRAVELDPAHVGSWVSLSRARLRRGDHRGAAAAIDTARRLQPNWASVRLQHADVLAATGRRDEAASVLADVVGTNPGTADLLRRAARRLAALGAEREALQAADALEALLPDDEDALLTRAVALVRAGRADEAAEAAAAVTPARAVGFMLDAGEPEHAWRLARAGAEVPARLLARTATALRRRGHLTLAEDALRSAAAAAPDDALLTAQAEAMGAERRVLRDGFTPPPLERRGYRARPGVVLHVVGHSSPYSQVGYTVRTDSIVRAQRAAGLEPHVMTRLGFPWDDGARDAPSHEVVDGVPHHRLRASTVTPGRLDERLAETVLAAERVLRDVRPAVLHAASDYRNAEVALALGEGFGVPVVYEVRGFWEETRLPAQGVGAEARECYLHHRERELACLRRVDRIVTLAEVMRDELVARGVDAGRISVVPNAVDEAFPLPDRDDALAERLGIASHEKVVGYVSSLSRYEGVEHLLDAAALLRDGGWPVRCLVVGDGEARVSLEAHAAAKDDPGLALFTGRVPHAEVHSYYSLIDVFVVPRTDDRVSQLVTPLKPYEAMATGRAVVVSRVPALAEMVVEGVSGLTFTPEDPVDLARVVETLLERPTRRAELAASARAWVLEHRTWRRNADVYLDLYRSLGAA